MRDMLHHVQAGRAMWVGFGAIRMLRRTVVVRLRLDLPLLPVR